MDDDTVDVVDELVPESISALTVPERRRANFCYSVRMKVEPHAAVPDLV